MNETVRRLHFSAIETPQNAPHEYCLKCGMLLIGNEPHRTINIERWKDSPRNCERGGPKPAKTIPLASGNAA